MNQATFTPLDSQSHALFPMFAASRADEVMRASVPLVAAGGWTAVTPRSVAEQLRCTRQCVHQWFGSQQSLRLRFAERFAWRYGDWMVARIRADGAIGMLPDTERVAEWVRCWWSIKESAMRDPEVRHLVEAEREVEARQLGRATERPQEELEPVHVLIEGLQARLCLGGSDPDLVMRARDSIRSILGTAPREA